MNFEHHNPAEVLKVANQFCSSRLVTLCEVCLEKKMETSLANSKKKSDRIGDLIDLIITAQVGCLFYGLSIRFVVYDCHFDV